LVDPKRASKQLLAVAVWLMLVAGDMLLLWETKPFVYALRVLYATDTRTQVQLRPRLRSVHGSK